MNVQLVNPLLSMVRELNHRMEALVKQLIAKDREIQDYKEHGALISRSQSSIKLSYYCNVLCVQNTWRLLHLWRKCLSLKCQLTARPELPIV